MLNHPTLDQLHALGLAGMAKAFADLATSAEAETMTHAEWLGLLLEREATDRYDRKRRPRLRNLRLRQHSVIVDIDQCGLRRPTTPPPERHQPAASGSKSMLRGDLIGIRSVSVARLAGK